MTSDDTKTLTEPRLASPADVARLLTKARLLVGQADHRGEARRLLEKILEEDGGSSVARQALELLDRLDAQERPGDARDQTFDQQRDEWRAIHGPDDGRLLPFLDRLQRAPASLEPLVREVERDLRLWLKRQADDLCDAREAGGAFVLEPRQLAAIEKLASYLAQITRFEVALRAELQRLADERFGLRLVELEPDIRRACQAWSIDEAWQLFAELQAAPTAFRQQVAALEAEIYDAARRRSAVDATLEQMPGDAAEPRTWPQLRRSLEAIGEIAEHADNELPGDWRDRLHRVTEQRVVAAARFLAEEAAGAHGLADLERYWQQYRHLDPPRFDARLTARGEWFDEAIEGLARELATRITAVVGPEDLDALAKSFAHQLATLPPWVAERCQTWTRQLTTVVDSWRASERGERFTLPTDSDLARPEMIPPAFTTALAQHRALLDEIDEAFRVLERPGAEPRAVLALPHRILRQMPGHVEAERLEKEAYRLERRHQIEEALTTWDVERFLLLADNDTSDIYRRLSEHRRALADLAARQVEAPFASTHEAGLWWRAWRAARRQLPRSLPSALATAVERQQNERQQQWRRVLEDLLDSEPSPEACRAAATSLGDATELDLEGYRRELERRERLGRARQLLAEERWDLAQKLLDELDADDPEHRRLVTSLAVGRARTVGVVAIAEALHRRWSDLLTYRGGEEAARLLEDALADAWRHGEKQALEQLQEVARRAVHSTAVAAEVRDRMGDWLEWLDLERRLAHEVTAAGLRRLITYLDSATANDLARRARTLVEHWREAGQDVALAWAWRAFTTLEPAVFPGVNDPAEALSQDACAVAEEVSRDLGRRADLARADLEAMRQQLEEAAAAWRDLGDFLDLLPHRPHRPEPPPSLAAARNQLDQLLTALVTVEKLENSDLRGAASRWSGLRLRLTQDLAGLPLAAELLRRLLPLEPLTALQFAENRLRRAARRCASSAPEDLDAEGLFAHLADCLDEIATELIAAGRQDAAMWQALSRDYWNEIPVTAGDLAGAASGAADLRALIARCRLLEDDERRFRRALADLRHHEPWVSASGDFEPQRHRDYLARYPGEAPRSRRVYLHFDRFARTSAQITILARSREALPPWIARYLKEGAPDVG